MRVREEEFNLLGTFIQRDKGPYINYVTHCSGMGRWGEGMQNILERYIGVGRGRYALYNCKLLSKENYKLNLTFHFIKTVSINIKIKLLIFGGVGFKTMIKV